jgi:predicted Zn-dependent protease
VIVVQTQGKRRSSVVWLVLMSLCLSADAQDHAKDEFQILLKQGFELHQKARFAEAIPVLAQARKLEPDDYFANLLLGIDLLRVGRAAEAIPRLELAAHVRPTEEFPAEYLGEANAKLGRYGSAVEAYKQAILRSHNSEQAIEAWAGFVLERFRQISEELRATQEGIAVARRLQQGATHPDQPHGCPATLAPLERKLAIRQPHLNVEDAYQLSICYAVEAGRAEQQLQVGAQDLAAVHQLRGDVFMRLKGDAAAAEAEYKQAIAIRSNDPGLLESLAEAQLAAGETDAAEQSANVALAIDPHRREALRTLAELAMNNRDYARAVPPLRRLVAEAPADRAAAVELAKALAGTDEPTEALRILAPALIAGYPDEKGALHALMAHSLRRLGRNEEAVVAETEARRLSDAFQTRSQDAPAVSGNELQ